MHVPGIHPTIDERIIHGIAHCQPINEQVELLNEGLLSYGRITGCYNEIDVKR